VRFLALLVSFALVQGPRALPPTRDQFLSLFGGYVDALRIQAGIPGMAGAIIDGESVLWQQAFGQQNPQTSVATRTDTPFHVDGLTQIFTATLALRCVEQGRLRLDTLLSNYVPNSPEPNATVAQVLTHTSGSTGALAYSYNPARLDLLKFAIAPCADQPFRKAMAGLLERLAMTDSVPGPDAMAASLPVLEQATPAESARYRDVFARLAAPYAVSATGQASPSRYPATTLAAGSGLISTVLDFAKFDLALKQGILLRSNTLAGAWNNPVNANGQVLPHGMGWFVQSYNGEPVVWQFGAGANASSSLVLTLPARNITLVLLANSDGLAKPPSLSAGDVTVSPFAKVFLGLVVK